MVEQQSCSGEILGWHEYVRRICERDPDPVPFHDMEYGEPWADAYLESQGIRNFTFRETLQLKNAGLQAPKPPSHWLPRIVPALWFAEALRERLNDLYGGGIGISIGNGFRPSPRHPELRGYFDLNKRVGGAKRSKHIMYRALDLDPVSRQHDIKRHTVIGVAMNLYHMIRKDVTAGIGTYRWSKRIHIDIGPDDPEMRGWGDRVRSAIWGPKADRKMNSKVLIENEVLR